MEHAHSFWQHHHQIPHRGAKNDVLSSMAVDNASWQPRESFFLHAVFVRKGVIHDTTQQLTEWCEENCEGLFDHAYHSWHVDKWLFYHLEDAASFVLAWGDLVDNSS